MTFDEWLLSCEAALTLHTSARLRQSQAGSHRSTSTGNGLRLRQHEAYRPGDERRFIDWKASRKDRTLLLRRFAAETQLQVIVLCDVSASMLFGQQLSKRQIALDCAGLLAFAALRQSDTFGLVAFADDIVAYHPPRQQRSAVIQSLETLWRYTPPETSATATHLTSVLQYLPVNRPALVCVLSDFRMPDDWHDTLNVLSAVHDAVAVCIEDDTETTLPAVGRVVVRDLESGQFIELDTASRRFRNAYREQMLAQHRSREQALQRACGAQYMMASASTNYQSNLLRLFLARTARTWA